MPASGLWAGGVGRPVWGGHHTPLTKALHPVVAPCTALPAPSRLIITLKGSQTASPGSRACPGGTVTDSRNLGGALPAGRAASEVRKAQSCCAKGRATCAGTSHSSTAPPVPLPRLAPATRSGAVALALLQLLPGLSFSPPAESYSKERPSRQEAQKAQGAILAAPSASQACPRPAGSTRDRPLPARAASTAAAAHAAAATRAPPPPPPPSRRPLCRPTAAGCAPCRAPPAPGAQP